MQAWGRIYAQSGLYDAVIAAATYYVMADPSEQVRLQMEWEEGVRNNVRHMGHFRDVMWHFNDQIKFLKLYYL